MILSKYPPHQRGQHTWKSSFNTKLAKEYIPTFFLSGLPSFMPFWFALLSVKHIVKARCIDSAVPSTKDFLVSLWSKLATFWSCRCKSGRLSIVIAHLARAAHSCIVAGNTKIPYVAFERAVMHALCKVILVANSQEDPTYLAKVLRRVCVPSKSSKSESLQYSRNS